MKFLVTFFSLFFFACAPVFAQETGPANSVMRVPSGGGKARMGTIDLGVAGSVGASVLRITNGGTNSSSALANNRVMKSSGGSIVEATAITGNRALASDANGIPVHVATTDTELGYVNGVTSAIQTQINAKAPLASPTFTGTVTTPVTASRAVVTGASSELAAATTTATEIGYVNGVTSAIQTQLDAKVVKSLYSATGDILYASGASTPATRAIGTNSQVLKVVAGVPTWANFSGGINYITDTDGSAIGSWVTYADAAASTPVDMTGGAPSSTFAVSTDSSLRGTTNFLWTHSAANRQGEGFSYNFTIDPSDKGKVLQIAFEYLVSSGTYADDDLQCWIYDRTNTVLIQPAPYKIKNSGLIEKASMEFQTASSSTSYRFGCHVATSTATAYTVRFANWSLGPQAKLYGSPVTDWVSFTPTGSFNTNVTYTGQWRRIGDSLEMQVNMAFSGAPNAVSSTINLPSGMTIDTAKIPGFVASTGPVLGTANVVTATSYKAFAYYNSTTSLGLAYQSNASGAVSLVNATAPGTLASTHQITVTTYRIPIVGWSSSAVMSSDAATTVVAARYTNVAGTSFTGGAEADVPFATKDYDTNSAFSTPTYTVPTPGKYRITVGLRIAATVFNVAGAAVYVRKNGSNVSRIALFNGSSASAIAYGATGADTLDLVAGDTILIRLIVDNTASLSTTAGDNHLTIERLSGPAQVAASDTVAALYTGAPPTGTLNSSWNKTTYGTKVSDTHGAYSSGTYTVPVSGRYSISAASQHSATYALTNVSGISVTINGTQKYKGIQIAAGATGNLYPLVSVNSVPLLAGDALTIEGLDSGTGPAYVSDATTNFFSITRTGNY